jgi:hypothetical protein
VATVTPRPVLALLALGVGTLAAGCLSLWYSTSSYLDHPLTPSSSSGNRVYVLPDGTLGAYAPFTTGLGPLVVGVGLALVVVAVVIGAATYRQR